MLKRIATAALAVLLITGLALAAGHRMAFRAHLTGAEEVPAVDTRAQGQFSLRLGEDGSSMHFRLNVANIDNVRASHIHLAPAGQNGPVVVALFTGPTREGRFQGTLAEGTFTAAELQGPLAGMSLEMLLEKIQMGECYVNVHTDANPPGEIRGQIQ